MFCEKLLCILPFFCIVLQIHAYSWIPSEEYALDVYLKHLSNLQGIDVTSYNDQERRQVCELGINFPLYTDVTVNNQIYSMKVKLPQQNVDVNIPQTSETIEVNLRVCENVEVILCGVDEDNWQYYFGKGGLVNSILVWVKRSTENEVVEAVGYIGNAHEN